MIELKIKTEARVELIDITEKVNHALAEIGADSGLCNLFVTHTTAAIIVSENWDPDVTTDMLTQLERIVPRERFPAWRRQLAGAYSVGDAVDFDQYPDAPGQACSGK